MSQTYEKAVVPEVTPYGNFNVKVGGLFVKDCEGMNICLPSYDQALLFGCCFRAIGYLPATRLFPFALLLLEHSDVKEYSFDSLVSFTGRFETYKGVQDTYFMPKLGDKKLPYMCKTAELALLFGLGYKYLGNNEGMKFGASMAKMLELSW